MARRGENINAYRMFVGKCKVKKSLGIPRNRRESDINMYIKEIEREIVE